VETRKSPTLARISQRDVVELRIFHLPQKNNAGRIGRNGARARKMRASASRRPRRAAAHIQVIRDPGILESWNLARLADTDEKTAKKSCTKPTAARPPADVDSAMTITEIARAGLCANQFLHQHIPLPDPGLASGQ